MSSHLEQLRQARDASMPLTVADEQAAERALQTFVTNAAHTHPGIQNARDLLLAFIAPRLPDAEISAALLKLNGADALLAAGALARDEAALEEISNRLPPVIEQAAVNVLRKRPQDLADFTRRTFVRLIYGENGAPKLESYLARGPLAGWTQVAATRYALNHLRDQKALDRHENKQLDQSGLVDAELQHIRARYKHEFRFAFDAGLAALSTRDRNLLRYHFLDSLSIDEIGNIYHVHRATAARWLADAREALLVQIKKACIARMKIKPEEFESFFAVVRSQIEFDLSSFFGGDAEPESEDNG